MQIKTMDEELDKYIKKIQFSSDDSISTRLAWKGMVICIPVGGEKNLMGYPFHESNLRLDPKMTILFRQPVSDQIDKKFSFAIIESSMWKGTVLKSFCRSDGQKWVNLEKRSQTMELRRSLGNHCRRQLSFVAECEA